SVRFIWPKQSTSLPLLVAPANWKKIDLDHFSFYLPPDMKPDSVQGDDSIVWQYSNSSIRLTIDWGQYPGGFEPYRNEPEYKEEWIKIDGKTAHSWSFRLSEDNTVAVIDDKRYDATICFVDTGIEGMKLTLWAGCKTKSDQETAKIIFQTIRFK